MIGIDVSEFQEPGQVDYREFTIVRAGNGRRRDNKWAGHVNAVRARNLPLSLYLYCEPDNNNPEFQAGIIVGVARDANIGKGVTLWADIEEGGGDLRWYEDRFVAYVNQAGWRCGVYSGDYFWRAHNLGGSQGRWKADYGPNDGNMHRPPNQPWDIWQYTSNPLDTNTADAAVVARLFAGAAPPPPPKKYYEDLLTLDD